MKTCIKLALKDIWKNKYLIILLNFQLFFAILFFMFTSTQVTTGINQIKTLNAYKNKDIFYYQIENQEGQYSTEIHQALVEKLDNNEAYASIDFYTIDEDENQKLIVVLGAFDHTFGLDSIYEKSQNETVCFIGSAVTTLSVGDTVHYGMLEKQSAEIVGRVPSYMQYMIGTRIDRLDDAIIISTDLETYKKAFFPNGLIQATSFINPSPAFIKAYAHDLNEANHIYTPISINEYATGIYDYLIKDGLSGTVLFLFVLIFVMISVLLSVKLWVFHRMKEYAIHFLYGATIQDLFLRVFIMVSSVILPTIIIFSHMYVALMFNQEVSPLLIACIYFVITFTLTYLPLRKLNHVELSDFLERRD